jgi:hypothetical protein
MELLDSYVNARTKSLVRCYECQHEWRVVPDSVWRSGNGCPKCSGHVTLTQEEASKRSYDRGIEMLGSYEGTQMKIGVRCHKCKHEWTVDPCSVWSAGQGCPKCGRISATEKQKLSLNEVDARFLSPGVERLGPYVTSNTRTLMRCLGCRHEWVTSTASVISLGTGCPKCRRISATERQKLSLSEVDARCFSKGVERVGPYVNSGTRTLLRCVECRHEWMTSPSSIISAGTGCPKCSEYGFNLGILGKLYCVSISNSNGPKVYKIGITNYTVQHRFKIDMKKIRVLQIERFSFIADARFEEQRLLKKYAQYRYLGPNLLECVRNREKFTVDILAMEPKRTGPNVWNYVDALAFMQQAA